MDSLLRADGQLYLDILNDIREVVIDYSGAVTRYGHHFTIRTPSSLAPVHIYPDSRIIVYYNNEAINLARYLQSALRKNNLEFGVEMHNLCNQRNELQRESLSAIRFLK
ncbi:hypothetical protein J4461_01390 [Candidatus Pacearchaeota archaeon]|nr:hypothetical protein [Candidatus Pacearchaeota archaeon]